MKNMKYITPNIYVKRLEMESLLTSLSGGKDDNGDGVSEIKSHTRIWDDDDETDNYSL